MKRVLTMLLIGAVLLCCFVGCGQKPDVSDPVVSGSDVSTTTTTTTTTEGDVTGDDTAGTEDTTTGAEDTTTDAVGTSGTQGTTGTQGTSGTKDTTTGTKGTTTTKDTTSGTKSTATTNTTKNTTTTTTKKTQVTGMFGSTTSGSSGGITLPSQNGGNKGYEFDPGDEWTLFWSDEFNGTTLDETKWTYEEGKGDFYTENRENVAVRDGNLIITARHEDPKENRGLNFSTGAINSSHKFSFKYGRLEFRARLPYGEGVWPALWTMGDYYLTTSDELGWPVCGEIDVMEMVGGGTEADKLLQVQNKQHTSGLHWGKDRENHKEMGAVKHRVSDGILADAYHVFAIEWDEESIKFFFDDEMCTEVFLSDPTMLDSFHQNHWIIINVALYNYEPFIADETTPLPQSMYVDYVRVYKKK